MGRHQYIIGIDPDSIKSGVATLRTSDKHMEVETLEFAKLLDYFLFLKKMSEQSSVIILVEAGWLNESHWHINPRDSKAVAAAKGNAVGRNGETGRKIVEMARHYGLEVEEVRPLKKCWRGQDGKISHDEIAYFIEGFPKRSNQEQRDSALLAWNWGGFPIRVPPLKSNVKGVKIN